MDVEASRDTIDESDSIGGIHVIDQSWSPVIDQCAAFEIF